MHNTNVYLLIVFKCYRHQIMHVNCTCSYAVYFSCFDNTAIYEEVSRISRFVLCT